MSPDRFHAIIRELIDENAFAIRAVLKILEVEFTDRVPTLAVTCEQRPRLLVNLGFVRANCATDAHVKALLCHEFLHVLLRHTETRGPLSHARHIAFDAVINAIIAREQGEAYASFFSRYYAQEKGIARLLRPMTVVEREWFSSLDNPPGWAKAWEGLYRGLLVADDLEELARSIGETSGAAPHLLGADAGQLLGNHEDLGKELPGELTRALGEAFKELNGSGIWRAPHGRGAATDSYQALINAADFPLQRWQAATLAVLRRHLTPSARSREMEAKERDFSIPVLSTGDRRAFLRTLWDPVLPQAIWPGTELKPRKTTQVYLDVSGSMYAEMPLLIALLGRLSRHIRRPFWAFSDHVAPAMIDGGRLRTSTTGGTSMACVLDHIANTQPEAAVVITDGYIEQLERASAQAKLGRTRLHALVSRAGSGAMLRAAGIPYTQLEELPR